MNLQFSHIGEEEKIVHSCTVYDRKTGNILYVHKFIMNKSNKKFSIEDMEEMTISSIEQNEKENHFGVYHFDGNLNMNPNKRYRFDLKSERLISEQLKSKNKDSGMKE